MSRPSNRLSRRRLLAQGCLAAAGLTCCGGPDGDAAPAPDPASGSTPRRPNVVLIYTDDENFEHIGCYGNPVHTPHHDRLAADGVRFNRFYSTVAICTPSRFSCVTGLYPSRCTHPGFQEKFPPGVQTVTSFNTPIDLEAPNLANILQKAGYATGMVGKWDLGVGMRARSGERGFEVWPATDAWTHVAGEADPRDPETSRKMRRTHDKLCEEVQAVGFDSVDRIVWMNPEFYGSHALNFHNIEWTTEGAVNFIDSNRDQPFFLYMAPTLHHIPHPQESLRQGDPRATAAGYLDKPPAGMPPRDSVIPRVQDAGCEAETAYCTWLDDALGAVLNRLDHHGIADDTIVIFCSDHQTHAKTTIYEGGVRTPCLMRYPRRIPGGQVSTALAQTIDFVPTILDYCGVSPDTGAYPDLDGVSLAPLLAGECDRAHDALFFEIGWTRAVCTDDWKYLALRYSDAAIQNQTRRGRRLYHEATLEPLQHKVLLEHPNFWDPDQLYDLRTDSAETTNRFAEPGRADVADEMQTRLRDWLKTFGDHPFPGFVE